MQTDEHRPRRHLYPWVGVLAGVVLLVAAAWAADFIPGDVNDDGVFDIADPMVLRRDLAGLGPGISQEVLCGNGVLDAGEECDSGASCSDLGFAFGELDCGAGCVAEVDTCTDVRFVNNRDGTISDHLTGLMWEEKTEAIDVSTACFFPDQFGEACLDPHSVVNRYFWHQAMVWLALVNNTMKREDPPGIAVGLGGYTDWRLPAHSELITILDTKEPYSRSGCVTTPCIHPAFGPWRSGPTLTSTLGFPPELTNVRGMNLSNGGGADMRLPAAGYLRAVRGQSRFSCGDGFLHPSEECEGLDNRGETCESLGFSGGPLFCNLSCTFSVGSCTGGPVCGNGIVEFREDCDVVPPIDGDCCSSTCRFEYSDTPCEDGLICPPDLECVPPGTCGGDGVPGECSGCTPTTCEAEGLECDGLQDGCGGSLFCGACSFPSVCVAGWCEFPPL